MRLEYVVGSRVLDELVDTVLRVNNGNSSHWVYLLPTLGRIESGAR